MKYYTLDNILSKKAQYNVIFGERSNGKTYAVLHYGLEKYLETGEQMGILRRWELDFKGINGRNVFKNLVSNGTVKKLSKGEWDDVVYDAGAWYLARFDEDLNKYVKDSNPLAYAFALSLQEHYKSSAFPNITTILFDEFLTRKAEIPDEFVIFMNVLSTIIRQRNNVTIFMCGNTVNAYSLYYKEMGLTNVRKMKKGQIDVYNYGESKLRVAVEYSDSPSKKKDSDLYFAFDNPKLKMITGGDWELAIYPHLNNKYLPKDVCYTFFVLFEEHILQCEVVNIVDDYFIYIHRKTTPLQNNSSDLIYTLEFVDKPNYRRNILKPFSKVEKLIYTLMQQDRLRYQDNEIGEIFRQYLVYCNNSSLVAS